MKRLDASTISIGSHAGKLRSELRDRIIGQDEAIEQVARFYQRFLLGLSRPNSTIGNYLFLGPTGTGKTRTVEALAEVLHGSSKNIVKIDCGEYQMDHEVAKLIGAPPGYLGHRETLPALSQAKLTSVQSDKNQISIILFDEIEKAAPALTRMLLGLLDKANLNMGDNSKVDFTRSMIFMTSNLGAKQMEALQQPGIGFSPRLEAAQSDKRIERIGVEAARRRFKPEFMNRIDKVVVFRPLRSGDLSCVLDLELKALQKRIAESGKSLNFQLNRGAREFLLREGTDMRYGARNLNRTIDRELVHPLSNLMASDQVSRGDEISVSFNARKNQLTFAKESGAKRAMMAARA